MNQLVQIWVEPREGIRHAAKSNQTLAFITCVPASGMVMCLYDVIKDQANRGSGALPASILLPNLLTEGVISLVGGFLGSYLVAWISRRLGGRGSAGHVRTVVAWSCLPFVPLLAISVPLVILGGDSSLFGPILVVFYLSALVMITWGLVIEIVGLSEVMAFSVPRSIAANVLSALLVVAGAMILVGIAMVIVKITQS